MLEAGAGAQVGLAQAGKRIGEQSDLADQVLGEQLLAPAIGVDVGEHCIARIGAQAHRVFAAVAAGGQVEPLAQAEQVALAEEEYRTLIHPGLQQAAFDDIQLVVRQLDLDILLVGDLQRRSRRL
ncbi:hypothetical protein D3C77_623520 [compost metagenome]